MVPSGHQQPGPHPGGGHTMYEISIDCRTQPGTYRDWHDAERAVVHALRAMPAGTVAAVWTDDGATQVLGYQVRRLAGKPRTIGRETHGATPTAWYPADPDGLTHEEFHRVTKAANR